MDYSIRPMNMGWVEMDKSLFTYKMNFGVPTKCMMNSFYIEGVKDKHIIVDAGCDGKQVMSKWPKSNAASTRGKPGKPIAGHIQTFEEALDKLGLVPNDIDLVIQTHCMIDHIANLTKCKKAKILMQIDELNFALSPHPYKGAYEPNLIQEVHESHKNGQCKVVSGDLEVEEGINVLFTPGHSHGCQSVSVETKKGTAIIAGNCSMKENWYPPKDYPYHVIPSGIHWDVLKTFDNMIRIKSNADIIVPLHCPEITKEPVIGI
ncbi:MAG: N-acyl homoserine lactonase family protein [Nitrososphaerales archaeon]